MSLSSPSACSTASDRAIARLRVTWPGAAKMLFVNCSSVAVFSSRDPRPFGDGRRKRLAGQNRKTGDFFRRLRPSPDTSAATCSGGGSRPRRDWIVTPTRCATGWRGWRRWRRRFKLFTHTPRTHACPPLACNSPRTFGTRGASRSAHSAECRDVRGSSRNKILSHSDAGETPWRATCRFQCGRRPGKRLNSSGRARSQAARCTGSIAC